jgi:hypothetical protein
MAHSNNLWLIVAVYVTAVETFERNVSTKLRGLVYQGEAFGLDNLGLSDEVSPELMNDDQLLTTNPLSDRIRGHL